ncbi:MAG: hypothetical protein MUE85_21760 [Microscillaceae bacterium]|jgi:hypothetical protein|nr:hypothetical protein [Microscillaceae bacterium]
MELDDLKDIWQKGHQNLKENPQHSVAEIINLLKTRTLGILAKINRSILIEVALTLAMMVLGIGYYWQIPTIAICFGGLGGVALVHYWLKYRILNNSKHLAGNLKDSLARLVRIFGRYMYGYYLLTWLMLVIANSVVLIDLIMESNRQKIAAGYLVFILAILLVWNVIIYIMVQIYLRVLYGNHFNNLKKCLNELVHSESEVVIEP